MNTQERALLSGLIAGLVCAGLAAWSVTLIDLVMPWWLALIIGVTVWAGWCQGAMEAEQTRLQVEKLERGKDAE